MVKKMKREYIWPDDVRKVDKVWVRCTRCKHPFKAKSYVEKRFRGSYNKCPKCSHALFVCAEITVGTWF
jgi:DNA-directed RNA polymerase subunit RPC12/RpoP